METEQFDGVFRLSNPFDEDFTFLWNNKEYTFPAHTRCPMLIPNEPSENIQEIRKKAAFKLAQRELLKSKEGKSIEKEAAKHFSPAVYDDKILQPYIDQCLSPLPIAEAKVKDIPKKKIAFKDGGSVVLSGTEGSASLGAADGAFKDFVPQEFGAMSA